MPSVMPARLNLVVVAVIITLILFYTSFRAPSPGDQDIVDLPPVHEGSRAKPAAKSSQTGNPIYKVQNETLGFQEIYMISLPGRTDKQDAFAMQAAFSEMSYTQMDGVYGHEVPPKALPHVCIVNGPLLCIMAANP